MSFMSKTALALTVSSLPAMTFASPDLRWQHTEYLYQTALVEEEGASERVNFSGKLRMLTQRITASACNVHAGIDVDASSAMLNAASAEFDQIMGALTVGDVELGIFGEETDRRVLMGLEALATQWSAMHVTVDAVKANGGSDAEISLMFNQSNGALDAAKALVVEMSAEYSDPAALLQADALTIDIAGRQRMLAQRISKNVCMIASGLEGEAALGQLAGAVQLYDASVNALRFGMEEASIRPAWTDEIEVGLDAIIADWNEAMPVIEAVLAGEEITDDQRAFIFHQMNSLTGQMNTLVGVYAEESKLDI